MSDKTLVRINKALFIVIVVAIISYVVMWIVGDTEARDASADLATPFAVAWFWTALKITERQRDRARADGWERGFSHACAARRCLDLSPNMTSIEYTNPWDATSSRGFAREQA